MLRLILILTLCLSFVSPLAAAEATVQDIYNAVTLHHYDQAEAMIHNVLQLHPKSAKAHYVAAEVYIKEGKRNQALQEYQTSLAIDPQLSFANPSSVEQLRSDLRLVNQNPITVNPIAASPSSASSSSSSNFIFYLIGGILVLSIVGGIIRRIFGGPSYGGGYPTPYGGFGGGPMGGMGGYGYPPQSGGIGSSIINGLAGGAALGAGMVAGEALAKSFTHPDGTVIQSPTPDSDQSQPLDTNFGVDTSSSWGDSSSSSSGSDGGSGGSDWS